MNTIQKEWKTYKDKVLHMDAGRVQISETRKAFYAGSASALGMVLNLASYEENVAVEMLE